MQAALSNPMRGRNIFSQTFLVKTASLGLLGGLIATLVMDLVLISIFAAAGMLPFTCFSIIGDTIANLIPGLNRVGSVPLGGVAHYIIGPMLGAIFGAAQKRIPALRAGSRKKAILSAVVYTEIVSQPLLALTPLLLRMTASESLLWFGGSFGMHFIWGCVFGIVWSQGYGRAVSKGH